MKARSGSTRSAPAETANLYVACDNGLGFPREGDEGDDHAGAGPGGCGVRPRSMADASVSGRRVSCPSAEAVTRNLRDASADQASCGPSSLDRLVRGSRRRSRSEHPHRSDGARTGGRRRGRYWRTSKQSAKSQPSGERTSRRERPSSTTRFSVRSARKSGRSERSTPKMKRPEWVFFDPSSGSVVRTSSSRKGRRRTVSILSTSRSSWSGFVK